MIYRLTGLLPLALLVTSCAQDDNPWSLSEVPAAEDFCVAAQRVVTRTEQPVLVEIHEDFTGFVKSKALIDGPTIQQYNWADEAGNIVGISCKLKSADHLNLTFGEGAAGPDGNCQDMNREVFMQVAESIEAPVFRRVTFDPNETVVNEENPGMTGPDWLAPYEATAEDADGALLIRTKGFIVNFTDPQYAEAPERFRGVHYCHFIAPEHFAALLAGEAAPGTRIGQSPEGMGRGY